MGKRNCANPGWNTIQCETGDFLFQNDCVGQVSFATPFPAGKIPSVTLVQSGSEGQGAQASHVNIYLAEVTETKFVLSASVHNHTSVHWQAMAMW